MTLTLHDPLLLYPLVLRIQIGAVLVDFNFREVDLDMVKAERVRANELRTAISGVGNFASSANLTATRLTVKTGPTNGLEYSKARHLRALTTGDTVTISECYTNRYALTIWQNAIVAAPPDVPWKIGGYGEEWCDVDLQFLHIEEDLT